MRWQRLTFMLYLEASTIFPGFHDAGHSCLLCKRSLQLSCCSWTSFQKQARFTRRWAHRAFIRSQPSTSTVLRVNTSTRFHLMARLLIVSVIIPCTGPYNLQPLSCESKRRLQFFKVSLGNAYFLHINSDKILMRIYTIVVVPTCLQLKLSARRRLDTIFHMHLFKYCARKILVSPHIHTHNSRHGAVLGLCLWYQRRLVVPIIWTSVVSPSIIVLPTARARTFCSDPVLGDSLNPNSQDSSSLIFSRCRGAVKKAWVLHDTNPCFCGADPGVHFEPGIQIWWLELDTSTGCF